MGEGPKESLSTAPPLHRLLYICRALRPYTASQYHPNNYWKTITTWKAWGALSLTKWPVEAKAKQ